MMTADFRKVLQSDKYPYMTIKFLEFKKSTGNRFEAVVEVKMMTVAKKYNIEFSNYNNKSYFQKCQRVIKAIFNKKSFYNCNYNQSKKTIC